MKLIRFLFRLGWFKTLYFNFRYLPFSQAIKLPVLLARTTYLRELKGKIQFNIPIKTGLVKIGFGQVGIFDQKKSRSIWEVSENGLVVFNGSCHLGHGSKLSVGKNGKVTFGNHFIITAESSIVAHKEIYFGNHCLLSWDTLIMDTDFHEIINDKQEVINPCTPIWIGDHVWIGCRCLILKGAKIPSFSVIGATTTINKEFEQEHALYAGNPAKIVKEQISWRM